MPARTPESRALIARIAAHERWARCDDPSAATAKARAAFVDRFAREVDPKGLLPPDVRARKAEHARKAYYTRLALRSAESRRKASEARSAARRHERAAAAADAALAEGEPAQT